MDYLSCNGPFIEVAVFFLLTFQLQHPLFYLILTDILFLFHQTEGQAVSLGGHSEDSGQLGRQRRRHDRQHAGQGLRTPAGWIQECLLHAESHL